jgi:hypothetical protein
MADQHVVNLHAATTVSNAAGALSAPGYNNFPSVTTAASPSSAESADTPTSDGGPRRKKTKKRKKCPHNRERYRCKDCKGSSICPHNRVKSQCKDCGGSQICQVTELHECSTHTPTDLFRIPVVAQQDRF